jgi:hypothetical protein
MPVSKKTSTTTAKSAKPRARRRKAVPTRDAIAIRAYELYLERVEGDDVAHWLQAERELAAV